jgi:hypothetical protein
LLHVVLRGVLKVTARRAPIEPDQIAVVLTSMSNAVIPFSPHCNSVAREDGREPAS